MADYLTTNWTEKIKSNPVANLILNNNSATFKVRTLSKNASVAVGKVKQMQFNVGNENAQGIAEIQALDSLIEAFRGAKPDTNVYANDEAKEEAVEAALQKGIGTYQDYDFTVNDGDYWANTYVQDYINIDHPKLRPCYIQALSNSPLSIKPPSVFFSDV